MHSYRVFSTLTVAPIMTEEEEHLLFLVPQLNLQKINALVTADVLWRDLKSLHLLCEQFSQTGLLFFYNIARYVISMASTLIHDLNQF